MDGTGNCAEAGTARGPPWKTLQSQSLQVCCTQLCESPTAHPKGPWELSPPDYFPFVYGHGRFFNLSHSKVIPGELLLLCF